jgi:ankyrin repeat protein
MNTIDQELIDAAKANNLPEVSRLLSIGADVNATNILGYTPLIKASLRGHMQVVTELLDHGADTEAKGIGGWTPLHWACYPYAAEEGNHNLAVVKTLLSGGANILAENNVGQLPIHLAVGRGQSAVAKYLFQLSYATTRCLPIHDLLKDLTWIGDPNITTGCVPPLFTALRRNVLGTDDVVEIVEFVVSRNSEFLRSRDPDGSLPLHVACRREVHFSIVQSLVNLNKASVKSVTCQGDLPLFLACEMTEPSLDTIFILVKLYPDFVYR